MAPGAYELPVSVTSDSKGHTGLAYHLTVRLTVADLVLPQEPAVLAVATTDTTDLAALYPATFGSLPAKYLDRGDPAQAAAVAQLDALLRSAHAEGVSLFVEDLAPALQVDTVGQVLLDWEAYDRTMAPYMTGAAFADGVGLAVWMAPLPPRRIADSPVQLRQYWQACLDHAAQKNWKVPAVLTHPAWDQRAASPTDQGAALRATRALEALQGLTDSSYVVAATAALARGAAEGSKASWLWIPDDGDTSLPPVGLLGDFSSVRAWPWLCQTRGVRGLLWRHAVAGPGTKSQGEAPLLWIPQVVTEESGALPTARLAWLRTGLNDTAHADLLARRAPAEVLAELHAAVVGRTGIGAAVAASDAATQPAATAPQTAPVVGAPGGGYLYAGWLADAALWRDLPAMVDALIAAQNPGAATERVDDPLYLSARMLLAGAHRPLARPEAWRFGLEPGREGAILHADLQLHTEHSLPSPTTLGITWPTLPGDLVLSQSDVTTNKPLAVELPGLGTRAATVNLQGHSAFLGDAARPFPMRITEQVGGTVVELPVVVPVHRMQAVIQPPRIDGRGTDWPVVPEDGSGIPPMSIALRYANKPDLLAARVRALDAPVAARAQWAYDADFLYVKIEVPQARVDDERTSEWPVAPGAKARWWGTDGLQVQIAGGGGALHLTPDTRVYDIGIKPSGTVLVRQALLGADGRPGRWSDAPAGGGGTGLRFALSRHDLPGGQHGYSAELAIPRKWFASEHDLDPNLPGWRVNVLRHESSTRVSSSWSGPLVDDDDLGMMGLLVGSNP
jgi:hypothetical protein